jgi:DNA-binding GntR family transcriptional regulator
MDTLEPVRASSLRDSVLPALRRAILDGRLPAGARLSESEISRAMRVSRSPVREAIAHLEQEGLAERYPNRGAFVADIFNRRAIAELAGLRNLLECFAVELAVARIAQQELAPLRAVTEEMDRAAARRDLPAIGDADFRFHAGLVSLADHRKLLQLWGGVAVQYWAWYLPKIQAMETDIEHWGRNHRLILDALADRRIDLARMYLEFNILNSAEQFRDLLADDGESDGADRDSQRRGERIAVLFAPLPARERSLQDGYDDAEDDERQEV